MDILKISAHSSSIAAAGALANTIRQNGEAELQVIGPKAVNQAVKAIAIARSYLASSGVDLVTIPSFVDVEFQGQRRTGLRFLVKPRHLIKDVETERLQPEREPEVEMPQQTPSLAEAIAGSVTQEPSEPLEDRQAASQSSSELDSTGPAELTEGGLDREDAAL